MKAEEDQNESHRRQGGAYIMEGYQQQQKVEEIFKKVQKSKSSPRK